MFRKPISLSLSILSISGLGWAVACSSTTNGGTPSSSSTNTVGNNSSSNTTSNNTGSASTTSSSAGTCAADPSQLVIDNMSSTSGAEISWKGQPSCDVSGYWYTFIGGGASASDVGSITPASSTEVTDGGSDAFYYTTIGAGSDAGYTKPAPDGGAATQTQAACAWGETPAAQYAFGAEGFYFAGVPTAGDAGGNTKTSVDISAHTGIQFWIYNALSTPTSMNFQISDQESQPDGGICGLDGSADEACNSPAFVQISVPSGWTFMQEPFVTLVVNQYFGYGDSKTAETMNRTVDTTKAYDVQWQVNQPLAPDAGGASVPFNFCVADVEFY